MTYAEYCKELTGYTPFTTYYDDLTIAEPFGTDAIKDTVDRALKHNLGYKYITELCMVVNHKSWIWYSRGNNELSEFYADLYYYVRDWCFENLKGDELHYFIETTD